MEYYLDVRFGLEGVAFGNQLLPQLGAIVNLSIADKLQGLILIGNRLSPAIEINDTQPRMPKRNAIVFKIANTVWPTVRERIGHSANGTELSSRYDPCNTAHSNETRSVTPSKKALFAELLYSPRHSFGNIYLRFVVQQSSGFRNIEGC
jgi:hypothetical protein